MGSSRASVLWRYIPDRTSHKGVLMNFEDAIIQAIANSFFSSHPSRQDQNGTVWYNPSPAQLVANQIYETKKKEILEAVIANFDADVLAQRIAEKLMKDLSERPASFSTALFGDAKVIQDRIRSKAIDILAAEEAEKLKTRFENEV